MATWTFVDFNVPQAQRLADLTGIEYDLGQADRYCELISQRRNAQSMEEWEMLGALCAAAIVNYGRTLTSGVRSGITKDQIELLPPDLQAAHHYFKALRDKWITHSVNAYEGSHVVAYLVPEERGPRAVSSISVQHSRVALLAQDDVEKLRVLVHELKSIIRREIETERRSVLEYAQSLPVDPFYAGEGSAVQIPTRSEAGRPRRRLGES